MTVAKKSSSGGFELSESTVGDDTVARVNKKIQLSIQMFNSSFDISTLSKKKGKAETSLVQSKTPSQIPELEAASQKILSILKEKGVVREENFERTSADMAEAIRDPRLLEFLGTSYGALLRDLLFPVLLDQIGSESDD
jgi:hypothetical protein